MVDRPTLAEKVAEDIRSEVSAGNLVPGTRLPTEAKLSEHYGVSRPTIRTALKQLAGLGLVKTFRGVGTFVVQRPAVHAGLERLSSITDSIRATGMTPGMIYAARLVRPVLPEEAAHMGVPGDTEVLELRRAILADGQVIAYSYDLMPTGLFPDGVDKDEPSGSIFQFLRQELGRDPVRGIGEIHAVASHHVGWGAEAASHDLFVLLNQKHYDADDNLLLYSRTYFIEGRYAFTIVRNDA